ncbi:MAG: hypothetical protein IKI11_06175 [Neisseriaceae bacterium]|nr:hypothetical protein [Neisseriaceae bacterium]
MANTVLASQVRLNFGLMTSSSTLQTSFVKVDTSYQLNLVFRLKPLQNLFLHIINVNVIGWAFLPTIRPTGRNIHKKQ